MSCTTRTGAFHVGLVLSALACCGFYGPLAALSAAPEPNNQATVEPEVYEALAAAEDGRAYVVVALEPLPRPTRANLERHKRAVAELQQRVLNALPKGEFLLGHRYRTIPALTGWVTPAGLKALASCPEVVSIGPDGTGHAALDDSVPFISADVVQHWGYTGHGITVAVLDTGVDTDHPDLSDNIAEGAHWFLGGSEGSGAEDCNGHGTNVAGIITSKGVVADPGVAPDTDILPIRVLYCDGSGYTSDWAAGVDYVVEHAGDYDYLCAINMSLGTDMLFTACPCDDYPTWNAVLAESIANAWSMGIAVFASSGNDGYCDRMSSPACLSHAVAVAAVYDQDLGREPDSGTYQDMSSEFGACYDAATGPDLVTCFSNRSPCNELAAPGARITAPDKGGGTNWYTGTSQAAPHCTALAALLAEIGYRQNFFFSPDFIVDAMKTTALPTIDPCDSTPNPGRIDASAAMAAAGVAPPCELDKLVASDAAMNHLFGSAVALSDDLIVVGQESPQAAYLFRRQGTEWIEEARLVPDDENAYYFGKSVAVDGVAEVVVVGDPWNRVPPDNWVGAAYVFRRQGDTWVKEAKLMAPDWAANDWFGMSVAIDGDRIVVGSYQDDDACPGNPNCDSGSAYVFEYGGGSWSYTAKLTASDAAQGDRFGIAVDLDDDRVLVGAYRDDDHGADSGAAYVFLYQGGTWTQEAKLTASDGAADDMFGYSVGLDGNRAVVGAWHDDVAGSNSGSAYVFLFSWGSWMEQAKLTPTDASTEDRFGQSVAIDGATVVVGSPYRDVAGIDSGAAYVFTLSGGWLWWEKYRVTGNDTASPDNFGWAVDVENGLVVGTARGDDSNTGSAYAFGAAVDCNSNGIPDLCDIQAGTSQDLNDDGIPDECQDPCAGQVLGDANCDGLVNAFDIDAFVLALTDLGAWEAAYGADCQAFCVCDINADGLLNAFDIDPFVELLTGK